MAERFAHNVTEIAETLRWKYADFSHYNKSNPLDELLFILCSTQTSEKNYQASYRALRREFPRMDMIAEAPAEYIAKPLTCGGLSNQKSVLIRGIMNVLVERFGRPTLSPLKYMSDAECESFLISLPGIGRKIARCIMMYSLNRQVFPVDVNCWRISRRLGWVRRTRPNGSCSPRDMDRLQAKIPLELRYSLHVNMISHGRQICISSHPRCGQCPIAVYCRRIGIQS